MFTTCHFTMNRLTPEQRLQIVQTYFKNYGSVRQTFRGLRPFYGRHNRPSEQVIRNTINRFCTTYTLMDKTHSQRQQTVRTKDVIAVVERSVEENPNESIRRRAQQLELCPSTLWNILRKDLGNEVHKEATRPMVTTKGDEYEDVVAAKNAIEVAKKIAEKQKKKPKKKATINVKLFDRAAIEKRKSKMKKQEKVTNG